jgi:hypothetical protein
LSDVGPLLRADEGFNHQIADTFATVGQSERSWTEKVCAMAAARDGSLQLAFGIGRYPNRNVTDAYAGISRGVEQWTVRASRSLSSDPESTVVGPIRYEVVEPLRAVRFSLGENDVMPISFEWTFEGAVPPFLEDREHHRSRDGFRVDADIVRYHQTGTAGGWLRLDGRTVELDGAGWVSTRDHSWGVRYMVGAPVPDVPPRPEPAGVSSLVIWSPSLFETAGGDRYALHLFYQRHALGDWSSVRFQGGIEHPDGTRERFASLAPDLRFRDDNRRLAGGSLHLFTEEGKERTIGVEPASPSGTGFHLGAGLYFGFDGRWHGQWRGELEVDGEHIADCSDPSVARRLHQMRDCVVRLEDPVGGAAGWGNMQTVALGADPRAGLTEAASFL